MTTFKNNRTVHQQISCVPVRALDRYLVVVFVQHISFIKFIWRIWHSNFINEKDFADICLWLNQTISPSLFANFIYYCNWGLVKKIVAQCWVAFLQSLESKMSKYAECIGDLEEALVTYNSEKEEIVQVMSELQGFDLFLIICLFKVIWYLKLCSVQNAKSTIVLF